LFYLSHHHHHHHPPVFSIFALFLFSIPPSSFIYDPIVSKGLSYNGHVAGLVFLWLILVPLFGLFPSLLANIL